MAKYERRRKFIFHQIQQGQGDFGVLRGKRKATRALKSGFNLAKNKNRRQKISYEKSSR